MVDRRRRSARNVKARPASPATGELDALQHRGQLRVRGRAALSRSRSLSLTRTHTHARKRTLSRDVTRLLLITRRHHMGSSPRETHHSTLIIPPPLRLNAGTHARTHAHTHAHGMQLSEAHQTPPAERRCPSLTSPSPSRGLPSPCLPLLRFRSPASCAARVPVPTPVLRPSPSPSSRRLPAPRAARRPPCSLRSPSRSRPRRREGGGERSYQVRSAAASLPRGSVVAILSETPSKRMCK